MANLISKFVEGNQTKKIDHPNFIKWNYPVDLFSTVKIFQITH